MDLGLIFGLALLGWLWGAGRHYWPGPLAVVTSIYYRATKRWSDPDVATDDDADDMSRHDTDPPDDRVRWIRRPEGPKPLDELLPADDEDDDGDPWQPLRGESRQDWVARQYDRGRRTTDITRHGSRHYGVAERTIQRDLSRLADDAEQGTMRRDR